VYRPYWIDEEPRVFFPDKLCPAGSEAAGERHAIDMVYRKFIQLRVCRTGSEAIANLRDDHSRKHPVYSRARTIHLFKSRPSWRREKSDPDWGLDRLLQCYPHKQRQSRHSRGAELRWTIRSLSIRQIHRTPRRTRRAQIAFFSLTLAIQPANQFQFFVISSSGSAFLRRAVLRGIHEGVVNRENLMD
jgi:hypothetical protein